MSLINSKSSDLGIFGNLKSILPHQCPELSCSSYVVGTSLLGSIFLGDLPRTFWESNIYLFIYLFIYFQFSDVDKVMTQEHLEENLAKSGYKPDLTVEKTPPPSQLKKRKKRSISWLSKYWNFYKDLEISNYFSCQREFNANGIRSTNGL